MSTTESHSPLNMSETVRDRLWFQRTTNIDPGPKRSSPDDLISYA